MPNVPEQGRCNLHGLAVRVENHCPSLQPWLDRFFAPFAATPQVGGLIATSGIVKPFDALEVLRNVTPLAAPIARVDDLAEVFASDERFWLVHEHWGICQINLLKRQWRSWLLPTPTVEPVRQLEGAVLWPLAQLLKMRGLELIPALSIQKDDWAALILCPWNLEPEIRRLEIDGYCVIARDWSILRAKEHRVDLLGMPPLRKNPLTAPSPNSGLLEIVDRQRLGIALECQAVFIIEPGRRTVTRGRTLSPAEAPAILRRAWPLNYPPIDAAPAAPPQSWRATAAASASNSPNAKWISCSSSNRRSAAAAAPKK